MASYLRDHVAPLLIGRDAAQHRGHLAVPLPRCVLAARAGDDGGDRGGRRGALGHQGQGRRTCRSTSCSVARAGPGCSPTPTPAALTLPALFDSIREHLELGYRAIRVQTGVPGLGQVYGVSRPGAGRDQRYDYEPAQRSAAPERRDVGHRGLPAPHARRVRGRARRVRPRTPPAARRAPPPDADPGRASWARLWSPTTCSGWRTARRPRTRKHSGSSGGTRRRRWRSARCSTRVGLPDPDRPSSSSTTSAPR